MHFDDLLTMDSAPTPRTMRRPVDIRRTWCLVVVVHAVGAMAENGSTARAAPPVVLVNGFIRLTFYPLPLDITRGSEETGYVNVTVTDAGYYSSDPWTLHGHSADRRIARMAGDDVSVVFTPDSAKWFVFNVSLRAVRLGRTHVRFYVTKNATRGEDVRPDRRTTPPGGQELNQTTPTAEVGGRMDGRRETDGDSLWEKPSGVTHENRSKTASSGSLLVIEENGANQGRRHEVGSLFGGEESDVADWPTMEWWLLGNYDVVVKRPIRSIEPWLDYTVMAFTAINLIGVGGQIDMDEVLYLIKTPTVLSVGLLCRFGVMPAIGLGLAEIMKPSYIVFIGVLSMLCSPHEGANCLLVLLAENDLTLSVTMTCVINFATVALFPLWTIVFETRIYDVPGHAEIPFREIFAVFGYILASVAVGYYVERRCPKLYAKFWSCLPAFTIFTVLFTLGVELYKSDFIFELVTTKVFFLAAMLAVAGYAFGSAVAFVARQPLSRIFVVSLETGCRTTYVTCLLLARSLDCPECDVARTAPVLGAVLSLAPGLVAVLAYRLYSRSRSARYPDTECTSSGSKEADDGDPWRGADGDEITELKETSM